MNTEFVTNPMDEQVQSLLHDMRNDLLAILMLSSDPNHPLTAQNTKLVMDCARKSLASADRLQQFRWASMKKRTPRLYDPDLNSF